MLAPAAPADNPQAFTRQPDPDAARHDLAERIRAATPTMPGLLALLHAVLLPAHDASDGWDGAA